MVSVLPGGRRPVLIVLLALLLSPELWSENLYFEKRDFSDLTDPSVTALVQDHRGYLWIGTVGGLIRYDGSEAVLFDSKSHPELSSARILSLEYIKETDEIWVGTVAGVHRFSLRDKQFRRVLLRHSGKRNPSTEILSLDAAPDGTVYALTIDGLYVSGRGDGMDQVTPRSPEGEAPPVYVDVCTDDRGGVWVAVNDSLALWDSDRKILEPIVGIPGVRCIASNAGDIWVGTESSTVYQVDLNSGETRRFRGYEESSVISFDSSDRVWVGSSNDGIAIIDPNTGETIFVEVDPQHPYKLPSGRIGSILRGFDRHIWIGTADQGLVSANTDKVNRLLYVSKSGTESLPGGAVNVVYEDSLGYLWAGSHIGGLVRIDPFYDDFYQYVHDDADFFSLGGDQVNAIVEDSLGRIWIGTDEGPSLYLAEVDGFEDPGGMLGRWPDFRGQNVLAMAAGDDGTVWMSLRDGRLYQLDSVERDFIVHRFSFSSAPTSLVVDNEGFLWAGSRQNLRRFDPEGVLEETISVVGLEEGGIPEGGISCLYLDSRQRLWLGTSVGALLKEPTNTGFRLLQLPGDKAMNVSDIVEDSSGNLWFSEGRSIHVFDTDGAFLSTMGADVGLTPSGLIKDMTLGSNGRVYIGANSEIWGFENYIKTPEIQVPNTYLNELRVLNDLRGSGHQIEEMGTLILSPEENIFSITFGTVDYRTERRTGYQYKLEGSHNEWVDNGAINSVTFARLPPGRFDFRVRAYDEFGGIGANEAKLAIRVIPVFWQTPWAIAVYVLLLGAIVAIIVKLREGVLLRNQVQELETARRKVLEANRKLEYLTMNDSLTGLLNRRGFDQALSHALTTSHRNGLMITVIMMDVDFFKPYNDNYGHVQGDEVLRNVGTVLRSVFERSTDIIARYGGEEFAVVYIGDNPNASVTLANDLILAVEKMGMKHEYSSVSKLLTLSSGITTIRTLSDTTEEELLVMADEALYSAKTGGRNRVCFSGILPELPETMKNGIAPLVFGEKS